MSSKQLSPARVPTQYVRLPLPSHLIQRECACEMNPGLSDKCEDCRKKQQTLQRQPRFNNNQPNSLRGIYSELDSSGAPLDSSARALMEPRFGHDFSRVRIHTGAKAGEAAKAVGALAFTLGSHIVFDLGQYSISTPEGRQLLAHELVHTFQQADSTNLGPGDELKISEPNEESEQNANLIAHQMLAPSLGRASS